MPQASEEQRARWGIGDEKATDFLQSRGYVLTGSFDWLAPSGAHEPTEEELDAAQFMQDEWDYGEILLPGTDQEPPRYTGRFSAA